MSTFLPCLKLADSQSIVSKQKQTRKAFADTACPMAVVSAQTEGTIVFGCIHFLLLDLSKRNVCLIIQNIWHHKPPHVISLSRSLPPPPWQFSMGSITIIVFTQILAQFKITEVADLDHALLIWVSYMHRVLIFKCLHVYVGCSWLLCLLHYITSKLLP